MNRLLYLLTLLSMTAFAAETPRITFSEADETIIRIKNLVDSAKIGTPDAKELLEKADYLAQVVGNEKFPTDNRFRQYQTLCAFKQFANSFFLQISSATQEKISIEEKCKDSQEGLTLKEIFDLQKKLALQEQLKAYIWHYPMLVFEKNWKQQTTLDALNASGLKDVALFVTSFADKHYEQTIEYPSVECVEQIRNDIKAQDDSCAPRITAEMLIAYGDEMFFDACQHGLHNVAERILVCTEKDSDTLKKILHQENATQQSPLAAAFETNNLKLAERIIKLDPSTTVRALVYGAQQKKVWVKEAVEMLKEKSDESSLEFLNTPDADGNTVLDHFLRNGNNVAGKLITMGAQCAKLRTPLKEVSAQSVKVHQHKFDAMEDYRQVARTLYEYMDNGKKLPKTVARSLILEAIRNKSLSTIALLMKMFSQDSEAFKEWVYGVIDEEINTDNLSAFRFLLQHKPSNSLESPKNQPILVNATTLAASKIRYPLLDLLIEHKVSATEVDKNGDTALHTACTSGDLTAAQKLLAYDKSVINKKNKYQETPLMKVVQFAPDQKIPALVNLLLEHGADQTIKNNDGKTVLDVIQGILIDGTFETETEHLSLEQAQESLINFKNAK